MNRIKKILPAGIKNFLKGVISFFRASVDLIKRRKRRFLRTFSKNSEAGYSFAILAVKKTAYIDMAIDNINSLHYINPNHHVTLYCDTACLEYVSGKKDKLDYPQKVAIIDSYGKEDRPWQESKIDTLIDASRKGMILTDADGIWHEDPIVDPEKITMLVIVNKIKEKVDELQLVETLFKKEWGDFTHYVTGFVSIPSRLMTEEVAADMRSFNALIFTEGKGLKRLSEELSINLALQSHYPAELFSTLKDEDGPGSTSSLQSLYYGCLNEITE